MAEQHNYRQRQRRQIQEQDRISSLPYDLLSHILSLLPTKHAVLTSILSKQWRRNWAMVTNLDFNDKLMFYPNNHSKDNRKCFSSFVERVLLYRHKSAIQTFRLQCHLKYHSGQLFNWISYAVDYGVRELDVSCFYNDGYENVQLPRNLFTNQKLVVLKLGSCMNVHVPISVLRLPNLRVLHLVKVSGLSDSGVKNLICNCPRLEQLVLIREFWDNLSTLDITSNSLILLVYREPHMDGEEDECNVLINAPKLLLFDLSHTLSRAFDMSVLPKFLIKANIDDVMEFIDEPADDDVNVHKNNLVNLFTGISCVRYLKLSNNTMHNLEIVSGIIAMPTFSNLIHLEVKIETKGWQILPKLLKCSPRLKHFVLNKECSNNDISMPHLEANYMSRLETIQVKGFDGSQADMDVVKNFLENALVLKRMTICVRKGVKKLEKVDIEKLRRFRRGSKSFQLRLCYN